MDSNDRGILTLLAKGLRDLRAQVVNLARQPGPAGKDGRDGKDGLDGKDGIGLRGLAGSAGADGARGQDGPQGVPGVDGERGPPGPMPKHEWKGTQLRFQQTEGRWGKWVDLQGKPGKTGSSGSVYVNSPPGGAGISNTPSGNIPATNVQAAINELDSEKVSKTGDTISGNLNVTGNVLVTGGGGLGYGIGSGGTVIQATSKSTAVTLNKPSGSISMHNDLLTAGESVEFALNNTLLGPYDGLVVNPQGFVGYAVEVAYFSTDTSVVLRVTNKGARRRDPVVILFRIIKGASS